MSTFILLKKIYLPIRHDNLIYYNMIIQKRSDNLSYYNWYNAKSSIFTMIKLWVLSYIHLINFKTNIMLC